MSGYSPKIKTDENGIPIKPETWIIVDSNGHQVGTQTFSSCASAQIACDQLNQMALKPQPPKTRAKGMSP